MKKAKKVEFEDLKQGQFCKYKNQIYLADDCDSPCSIQLTGRNVGDVDKLDNDTLVIPIKVKIVEVK